MFANLERGISLDNRLTVPISLVTECFPCSNTCVSFFRHPGSPRHPPAPSPALLIPQPGGVWIHSVAMLSWAETPNFVTPLLLRKSIPAHTGRKSKPCLRWVTSPRPGSFSWMFPPSSRPLGSAPLVAFVRTVSDFELSCTWRRPTRNSLEGSFFFVFFLKICSSHFQTTPKSYTRLSRDISKWSRAIKKDKRCQRRTWWVRAAAVTCP